MQRKKQVAKLESYWFAIDNWYRKFSFGINHHPWEMSPGHFDEHDTITVVGRLRSQTHRKFAMGELYLLPSQVPHAEWSDETDRIGNAWIKDGKLCCSAWIQNDAFYSLPPAFAVHRFKEMVMTVCDLRYNKGKTDFIRLHHEITELDDE